MNNTFKTLTAAFLLVVTLSACTGDDRDTATTTTQQATATTQPRAEYTLNVCLAEEPASLFFYGDDSAARTILEGIYDGPIDTLGYAYQSSLLEAVPSLANGDTVLADVAVKTGDTIVDAYGSLVAFQPGVTYFPSGCTSADCAVAHTRAAGEQVTMQQLVVSFKIRSGVQWADGEPLRAQDSVFSFETAKNLQAAGYSNLVNHTQSYKALDVRTVEWRGVPGYRHSAYAASFFTPLPKHLLGNMTVEQLLSADQVNRSPLGWGAFQLAEWQPGTAVKLVKNPNYFRSDEGLPYFDAVVFHFTGTDAAQAVDSLLSGQCDVLDPQINLADQADRLLQLQTAGEVGLAFASAGAWEHLDFGIVPLGYDDGYRHVGGDRADYFGDVRTRRAIAMCIDRQALIDQLAFGQSVPMNTYLPPEHPLYNQDVPQYPYDPAAAAALLDEVGWLLGENGVRLSQGVQGVLNNTPLEFNYYTTNTLQHQRTAKLIAANLSACGISLKLGAGSAAELFASGPTGALFGRAFDTAQFAWPNAVEPPCYLYTSSSIPGEDIAAFAFGWGGGNLTGWSSPQFDAACAAARAALPGQPAHAANHMLAQAIFAEALPVIPLYLTQRIIAFRPDMCAVDFDATAGWLWNLEAFAYGDLCP